MTRNLHALHHLHFVGVRWLKALLAMTDDIPHDDPAIKCIASNVIACRLLSSCVSLFFLWPALGRKHLSKLCTWNLLAKSLIVTRFPVVLAWLPTSQLLPWRITAPLRPPASGRVPVLAVLHSFTLFAAYLHYLNWQRALIQFIWLCGFQPFALLAGMEPFSVMPSIYLKWF